MGDCGNTAVIAVIPRERRRTLRYYHGNNMLSCNFEPTNQQYYQNSAANTITILTISLISGRRSAHTVQSENIEEVDSYLTCVDKCDEAVTYWCNKQAKCMVLLHPPGTLYLLTFDCAKHSHFQMPPENPSVQTQLVLLYCIKRLCIFGRLRRCTNPLLVSRRSR